jgi:hypothetical protein
LSRGRGLYQKTVSIRRGESAVETHLHCAQLQLSLEDQVERQVKEIVELQMGMIFGLAKLA